VESGRASRTAVLVCQGRAAADGLVAPGVFSDPVAVELLTEDERVPVLQVRARTPPRGAAARLTYESVRASATGMVPRTIAIDEAVAERPCPQLVVLGAGLDDRAWRMARLADVDVLEVDHPASQVDKRDRVGDLPPVCGSLHFVAVDFGRDSLGTSLESAGHDRTRATTWLWEGVVAYLTEAQVTRTLAAVARRSAPGSRLVVNYQAPSATATVGRYAAHAMSWFARQPAVWTDEPRRSAWTPERMAALLRVHGFAVADDRDLLTLARERSLPVTHARSLASGRIAVADR
jgi:methyltransferase (TIGR00027 family)